MGIPKHNQVSDIIEMLLQAFIDAGCEAEGISTYGPASGTDDGIWTLKIEVEFFEPPVTYNL